MMRIAILLALPLALLLLGFASPEAARSTEVAPAAAEAEACPRSDEAEYIGEASCKKCHFQQHRTWKKTTMAKTFEILKPGKGVAAKKKWKLDPNKDYTKDASCLPCHTTGYGKPGGYPVLSNSWTAEEKARAKKMEGVQCESCHGPGSKTSVYKKDNEKYKRADLYPLGLVDPDANNCKTCHNTKSPTVDPKTFKFDYKALTKDGKKIHRHRKLKHPH